MTNVLSAIFSMNSLLQFQILKLMIRIICHLLSSMLIIAYSFLPSSHLMYFMF